MTATVAAFHEGQAVVWVAAPNHPDDPEPGTPCEVVEPKALADMFAVPLIEVVFPDGRRALACDSDLEAA